MRIEMTKEQRDLLLLLQKKPGCVVVGRAAQSAASALAGWGLIFSIGGQSVIYAGKTSVLSCYVITKEGEEALKDS